MRVGYHEPMRRALIVLLNAVGVVCLAAAGVLAWNAYSPIMPPLPADAIVVDENSPAVESPPPAPASAGNSDATPVPALLPETKPRPTPIPSEPDVRRQQQEARREDRKTQAELEAMRARAFPPPANSAPTRLIVPAIEVDSPIMEVGMKLTNENGHVVNEWEVADFAVGFHNTTALPGAVGNTVMAGHNNINGEVFRRLSEIKAGDEVFVMVGETTYRYTVEKKLLLKEKGVPFEQRLQNAAWIAPTADVRLTLVSCWPYTSNTYRVIVVAKPVTS